jgi:Protein of unknown function (DUF3489)
MTDTTSNPAAKRPRRMAREPQLDTASVQDASPVTSEPAQPSEKTPSKASLVLDLLSRPEGASLDQLVEATGWLPHTTRAALTGLKKKGHKIERRKVDERTTYFRV